MYVRSRRRRHAGVGNRLVLWQSLRPQLSTARRGRGGVELVGAGLENRAVILLRSVPADIAAAHIARQTVEIAVERRAEAAAAAGAQYIGVAGVQHLVERLTVVEALLLRLAEAVDGDRVAVAGEPAVEPPRLALPPIDLRIEADVGACLHHLLAAEPAAEAPGAAGIRPQRVALDQERIFRFDLLGRTVVSIAVIHGDGGVAAVAVVLGAPAAADQPAEIDVEAVVLGSAAIDAPDHEIGVMAGDDVLGNGGGARPGNGG